MKVKSLTFILFLGLIGLFVNIGNAAVWYVDDAPLGGYVNSWEPLEISNFLIDVAISSTGQYQTAVSGDPYWGELGDIYISSDYGNTWTPLENLDMWAGIAISSTGQYQTAVSGNIFLGAPGDIYISSDYGNTWAATDNWQMWTSVAISSTGQYQTAVSGNIFSGEPGDIYISSDYGNTWTPLENLDMWADIAISSTGQYQTAVAADPIIDAPGDIYISSDYGNTWAATDNWQMWTSVAISSTGQYQTAVSGNIFSGEPGDIYISSDYGNTWTPLENLDMWADIAISSTGQYQTAVAADPIIDAPGDIYISSDYGNTWTPLENLDMWAGITISSTGQYQTAVSGNIIFSGEPGDIYISSDYGNTWAATDNWQMWTSVAMSSTGQYQTALSYEGQIYISHPRDENGESWSGAFRFLQDALAVASTDEEIRVAQGTYNPDQDKTHPEGTGNKAVTFQLINEVTIKGGYAGLSNPSNPDERNIKTYQTILSGDLAVNDGNPPNFTNYGDNSYHVITSIGTDNTAILDGFTITGGNATGSSEKAFGGGLFNRGIQAGSPTITNCIFNYNRAYYGGAVHNGPFPGSPPKEQNRRTVISNCIFDHNTSREGGAINGSFLGITNCVFTNNTADANGRYGYGGAIAGGDGETTNCTFYGNTAVTHGGAICTGVRALTLTNCIFWGNSDDIVGSPFVNYCNVENPTTIGDNRWTRGTGNISENPLFINADEPAGQDEIWRTLDDGLRIFINSPCIDVADDNIALLTDITDKERIDIPEIGFALADMGAYESGHDSDGDGMPDEWEILYGLDPYNPDDASQDVDVDGLTNLQEYQQGTNPTDSDTDGDGMPDGWEVDNNLNPLVNDADQDADSDGLNNFEEYNNNCDPNDSDTDNDGLNDGDEVNIYGTNPTNSDTDGDWMPDGWEVQYSFNPLDSGDADQDADNDGLTNLAEYQYGSHPINPDTDNDSMPDGWEVLYGLNPLTDDASEDPDEDGLTNLQEYQTGTDPLNSNTDMDGLTDGDEVNIYGTNPNNPDSDDDGLTDGDEINIYNTNPLNSDTDSDGMPDGWEVQYGLNTMVDDANLDKDIDGLPNIWEYTYGFNPNNSEDAAQDSDNDGLINFQEYNTGTNPNNSDTDGDGMPDGWEVDNNLNPLVNDAGEDADSDGLNNFEEYNNNCDPNDSDTDNDGLNDGDEVNIYGTNPNNPDSDDDGLTDGDEINTHGTNPNKHDTDDDLIYDGWEVLYGLNPFANDADQDPDSDGLNNLQEMNYNCNPNNSDTDGDGTNDGTEVGQGSFPNDPSDNGQPPSQNETSILTIHCYGDSSKDIAYFEIAGIGRQYAPGYTRSAGDLTFNLWRGREYTLTLKGVKAILPDDGTVSLGWDVIPDHCMFINDSPNSIHYPCQVITTMTWQIIVVGVDLQLNNMSSTVGSPAPMNETIEETEGAEIKINADFDEGNTLEDFRVSGIVGDDPDLLQGTLHIEGGSAQGKWKLLFPNKVKAYRQDGDNWPEITSNTLSDEITLPQDVPLRIEGIDGSTATKDIEVRAEFYPTGSGQASTDTALLTVVKTEFMLTFDDGPFSDVNKTMTVVNDLNNILVNGQKVKAAFFMVGHDDSGDYFTDIAGKEGIDGPDNDNGNYSLAQTVTGASHSVGNHTDTHKHAWTAIGFPVSVSDYETEITNCEARINDALGGVEKIFRPPYWGLYGGFGAYNDNVTTASSNQGYQIIWGKSGLGDYNNHDNPNSIKQESFDHLENWNTKTAPNQKSKPAILTYHEFWGSIYDEMDNIIPYLRDKGFVLVNFDKNNTYPDRITYQYDE